MENKTYNIVYLETFRKQLRSILRYVSKKLKEPEAANRLYICIREKIQERKDIPENFKPLKIIKYKNGKTIKIYNINVKNFVIIYSVNKKDIIIKRIFYNKMNIKELI